MNKNLSENLANHDLKLKRVTFFDQELEFFQFKS